MITISAIQDEQLLEMASAAIPANAMFNATGFAQFAVLFQGSGAMWNVDKLEFHLSRLFLPTDTILNPITVHCSVGFIEQGNAPHNDWAIEGATAAFDPVALKIHVRAKIRARGAQTKIHGIFFHVGFLARLANPAPQVISQLGVGTLNVGGDAIVLGTTTANRLVSKRADIADLFVPYDPEVPVVRHVIYVRGAGMDNDPAHDGSDDMHAYRTVQRALQDVPLVLARQRIVIDCSGIGQETFLPRSVIDTTTMAPTEVINSGYQFPCALGPGRVYLSTENDAAWNEVQSFIPIDPHFWIEYDVTIAAALVDDTAPMSGGSSATIDAFPLTVVADPWSGLIRLTRPSSPGNEWATNQFQGKFVELNIFDPSDPGSPWKEVIPITSNDASSFEVALPEQYGIDTTQAPKLKMCSAEFVAPLGWKGIQIQAINATIGFYGIKVSSPDSGCETPLTVQGSRWLNMSYCQLDGLRVTNNGPGCSVNFCIFDSGGDEIFRRLRLDGAFSAQSSFFRNLALYQVSSGDAGNTTIFYCGFQGCTPVGHGEGVRLGHTDSGYLHGLTPFVIRGCHIMDADGAGVAYYGGTNGYVQRVLIERSNGYGVVAYGAGVLTLITVGITGTIRDAVKQVGGTAIRVMEGGQVTVGTVSGMPDPVGLLPVNQGYGAEVTENGQLRITDRYAKVIDVAPDQFKLDPANTLLIEYSGALGDLRVGTLQPTPMAPLTWDWLREPGRFLDAAGHVVNLPCTKVYLDPVDGSRVVHHADERLT